MVGTLITISHTLGAKPIALLVDANGVGIPCMFKSPGEVAYDAFYRTSYGQYLTHDVALPKYKEQHPDVQTAWEDCAEAVLNMKGSNYDRPSEDKEEKGKKA